MKHLKMDPDFFAEASDVLNSSYFACPKIADPAAQVKAAEARDRERRLLRGALLHAGGYGDLPREARGIYDRARAAISAD